MSAPARSPHPLAPKADGNGSWCVADVVPQEYGLFYEEFKRQPNNTWIMKPVGRAQGKGIFLFTKLSQISDWKKSFKWRPNTGPADQEQEEQVETYVAQRYIDNPYLIGGTKFDMRYPPPTHPAAFLRRGQADWNFFLCEIRLYVLVTSFSPLTVWIYRAGFARFSMARFSAKKKDIANAGIHLTNVAVAKKMDVSHTARFCRQTLRNFLAVAQVYLKACCGWVCRGMRSGRAVVRTGTRTPRRCRCAS